MPELRYDVFEFDEPAYVLVSDAEMQSGRPDTPSMPIGDDEGAEIAHAVTARVAAELVGLPPSWVERLERHIAEFGSFGVGNLTENWEVRRSCDD